MQTRSKFQDPCYREVSATHLPVKLPTVVAMAHKYSISQPFVYPQNDLSYSANFMRMMFSNPREEYKAKDVLVCALGRILIPHADHRQNASSLTARLAGSSGTNPFASNLASIACLCGIAHCGANEAALYMHKEIGSVDSTRVRQAGGVKNRGVEIRTPAGNR